MQGTFSFHLLTLVDIFNWSLIGHCVKEILYVNSSFKEQSGEIKTRRYTFSPVSDVDVEESMFTSFYFFSGLWTHFFKTKARFPLGNKWQRRKMIFGWHSFLALVQTFLSPDIKSFLYLFQIIVNAFHLFYRIAYVNKICC